MEVHHKSVSHSASPDFVGRQDAFGSLGHLVDAPHGLRLNGRIHKLLAGLKTETSPHPNDEGAYRQGRYWISSGPPKVCQGDAGYDG